MEPRQALRRARSRKESVRITRRGDVPSVYGFPLAVSRSLVLLRNVDDFDIDGFTVLPLANLADVRSGDCERFVERVLRDEGQLRAIISPPFPVGLDSWQDVFSALAGAGEVMIAECEDNPSESFCIGVVTGLTAGAVGIHQFDATAAWDSAPTVVPYQDITRVRFAERYTDVFARYLSDPRAS